MKRYELWSDGRMAVSLRGEWVDYEEAQSLEYENAQIRKANLEFRGENKALREMVLKLLAPLQRYYDQDPRAGNPGSTHWGGCEKEHLECQAFRAINETRKITSLEAQRPLGNDPAPDHQPERDKLD